MVKKGVSANRLCGWLCPRTFFYLALFIGITLGITLSRYDFYGFHGDDYWLGIFIPLAALFTYWCMYISSHHNKEHCLFGRCPPFVKGLLDLFVLAFFFEVMPFIMFGSGPLRRGSGESIMVSYTIFIFIVMLWEAYHYQYLWQREKGKFPLSLKLGSSGLILALLVAALGKPNLLGMWIVERIPLNVVGDFLGELLFITMLPGDFFFYFALGILVSFVYTFVHQRK